jgi:hypothetical protein
MYNINKYNRTTIITNIQKADKEDIKKLISALDKYNSTNKDKNARVNFISTVRQIKNDNQNIRNLFENGRGVGYYFAKTFKANVNSWGDNNTYVADRFEEIIENLKQTKEIPSSDQVDNHITKEMMDIMSIVEKNIQLSPTELYNICNKVFFDSRFSNINNNIIKQMMEAIIVLVAKDRLWSNDVYEIFNAAVIEPKGIFSNDNDIRQKMMEAILKLLTKNKLHSDDIYKIFNALFLDSRLSNTNNDIIKQMMEAIIVLVGKDRLWPNQMYEIFNAVFIEPKGIFSGDNTITQQMMYAILELVKNDRIYRQERQQIFDSYLNSSDTNSISFKRLESLMLSLVVEGKLQDPEVLKKIANRISVGLISIAEINQGVKFFTILFSNVGVPLIKILCQNIDYFITKDGIDCIKDCLKNNLLITPLQDSEIETLARNELIGKLKSIKADIDEQLINEYIIENLINDNLNNKISTIIKEKIKRLEQTYKNNNAHNISEDDLSSLVLLIKDSQLNPKAKNFKMKQLIKARWFISDDELTEEQLNNIKDINEKFVTSLNDISIEYITKEVLKSYFELLAIEENRYNDSYEVIKKYLNWNKTINKLKQNKYNEIQNEVISYDKNLKNSDSNYIYYDYVLNTLPYRSYENILDILNTNNNIPDLYKEKLLCVVTYCQLNNFDTNDNSLLNILILKSKTEENILISLQNLDYLNSNNINGFTLEQFKINKFTSELYTKFVNVYNDTNYLFDLHEKEINNLTQLLNNNTFEFEIISILNSLITKKVISKNDLMIFINNHIIKTHLKEINSEELCLSHLNDIKFPLYLKNLISNKFTASNLVAKNVYSVIGRIVSQYNFKITSTQTKKLEEICYQVVSKINSDVSVSLEFKKQLINDFNDGNLLISATEETGDNGETKITIPDGEFIQLIKFLVSELSKVEQANYHTQLPILLVTKAEQLTFTQDNAIILKNLHDELIKLPSENIISQHETAYILGVIFMCISSVNVLGYHVGNDNTSFTRFRLMAGYWLAKAITISDNNWDDDQKKAISQEIKQAILADECSGQISNKLYGVYCESSLKAIRDKIGAFLNQTLL